MSRFLKSPAAQLFVRAIMEKYIFSTGLSLKKSYKNSYRNLAMFEMPFASSATCQCVVNMVLVSCCLPGMFSTLQNFSLVYTISHFSICCNYTALVNNIFRRLSDASLPAHCIANKKPRAGCLSVYGALAHARQTCFVCRQE